MLFLLPISKYCDKVELRRLRVCIPAPPKSAKGHKVGRGFN